MGDLDIYVRIPNRTNVSTGQDCCYFITFFAIKDLLKYEVINLEQFKGFCIVTINPIVK
jgi:hypothetical protein